MNSNINLYATKEEYYETKRLSGFSMLTIAGSFIINALIIGYAVITALVG